MERYSLATALLIYLSFSLFTLSLWEKKGINTLTGDEPHYLVMADGLAHGSVEQTAPYKHEFKTRAIYKPGLAPPDAVPSPSNTHAVQGPNGLFNIHNIGLPLLLIVPFVLGGVIGAKTFMVLSGAFIVWSVWEFTGRFAENNSHRFWTVVSAAIAMPFIPAAGQIYPDVLAGVIALVGLLWFLTTHERRSNAHEIILASAIACLPWLQIKFAVTSVFLILAISGKIYLESRSVRKLVKILLIAGISYTVLAIYNQYAFGKVTGPYQSDALELSQTSLMVLLGLHLDQNQGLLFLNPVNLIGVIAIGWIYARSRIFALVWAVTFLSLIVPNALHPNWYGGFSFSGRFAWAASAVFLVPTALGLLKLAAKSQKGFATVVLVSLLLQLHFFYQYAVVGAALHNKGAAAWFDTYSIFYFPAHAWLPMLYNSDWAFRYGPNYAWCILVGGLFAMGFINRGKNDGKTLALAVLSLVLIATSGLYKPQQATETIFHGNQLPYQTGRTLDSGRLAERSLDNAGFLTYGPYFPLRKGRYEVMLAYSSYAMPTDTVGWFDVFNATTQTQVTYTPIRGSNNANHELTVHFQAEQWTPNSFEFRTHWDGVSTLHVRHIRLKKL